MKISGIYQIKNIINDKVYVGKSVDIENRFLIHLSRLKNNKHVNQHLQRAWNKYGEGNFKFETIEVCEGNKVLNEKEKQCIKKYQNKGLCYNIAEGGIGGDTISQHPNKGKILKKISLATTGCRNPNYGKHWDEEHKKNQSDRKIGNWKGNKNPNYGRGNLMKKESNRNYKVVPEEVQKDIIKMYLKGYPTVFIGKKFNLDSHGHMVRRVLKENDIHIRSMSEAKISALRIKE